MADGARVNNGKDWAPVQDRPISGKYAPVPPMFDGDDKIFVSIPSYRDGERCGKTIVDLFAKAKDPDKIVVGLIEQSYEEDLYCLESYCKEMGTTIYNKNTIRKDTTKVIANPHRDHCPRIDQIRKLSVHHYAAKGPMWARSLTRKILGNEEFCLQIDAHTEFVNEWDDKLKHEWAATGNEFGILSTVPLAISEHGTTPSHTVPRQCMVEFLEVGIPHYTSRADGTVENLKKPLLSHAWSAGFSFSKCHLEEAVPYDPFTPYVVGAEQFSRFARLWTRGYDVYTPTQNIVFHNYQANPDGHGTMEWLRPRFERERQTALKRIRSTLELPNGLEVFNLGNLGIYGLGKRRSLEQLSSFVKIDMASQGSRAVSLPCGDDEWVPYDSNISPVANLYDKPDNLDAQPEFPMRTEFAFYKEMDWESPQLDMLANDMNLDGDHPATENAPVGGAQIEESTFPTATILLLWVIGLCVWCANFLVPAQRPRVTKKRRARKAAPTIIDGGAKIA